MKTITRLLSASAGLGIALATASCSSTAALQHSPVSTTNPLVDTQSVIYRDSVGQAVARTWNSYDGSFGWFVYLSKPAGPTVFAVGGAGWAQITAIPDGKIIASGQVISVNEMGTPLDGHVTQSDVSVPAIDNLTGAAAAQGAGTEVIFG